MFLLKSNYIQSKPCFSSGLFDNRVFYYLDHAKMYYLTVFSFEIFFPKFASIECRTRIACHMGRRENLSSYVLKYL